jgi:predicted DNA-binding transcriptional regulator YafY
MALTSFFIDLLKKVPREPQKGITSNELVNLLQAHRGKSGSLESMRRKVLNNLHSINKLFKDALLVEGPVKHKTYRLRADAPMLLQPMTDEQTMAFGLLSKYGSDLLPAQAQNTLKPFYMDAERAVADHIEDSGLDPLSSKYLAGRWLQKIAVVPAVMPFCAPKVDEKILRAVHEALMLERRLMLSVVQSPSGESFECEVSPLALVQQGVRTYLIAKRTDQPKAQRFLLARIRDAQQVTGHYEKPNKWSLNQFLRQGIGHPVFESDQYGQMIPLVLHVHADTQWLKETPLAPLPRIEEIEDGSYLFKVELPLTEELCHWLLSMSFHVKVISPAFLAERIQSDLQMSLGMYQGTQSMANS